MKLAPNQQEVEVLERLKSVGDFTVFLGWLRRERDLAVEQALYSTPDIQPMASGRAQILGEILKTVANSREMYQKLSSGKR